MTDFNRTYWSSMAATALVALNPITSCAAVGSPSSPQVAPQRQAVVAESDGALAADLEELIRNAAANGFSGVLVVNHNGARVVSSGVGMANRAKRTPFTTSTLHDIGSLTKQFTAASIMTLVADGQVSLDGKVRDYLPDAAKPGASLTVRQLLTHRGGVPEYCGDEEADATKTAMLSRCMAAVDSNKQSAWHYSNPGFSTLGMIVEQVSGEGLDTFMKRRVLVPAGVTGTGYVLSNERARALGYDAGIPHLGFAGAQVLNGHHWNIAGNGGVLSTADDMVKWGEALMAPGHGLAEPVRLELTSPHAPRAGSRLSDGYGWVFVMDAAGQVESMSHSGSDGVFLSYLYFRPKSRTMFYFHSNVGEDASLPLLRAIRTRINNVK